MNIIIDTKINDYGLKLQKDFIIKAKIQEDYDKGIFDGTWRYEDKIETIEDAIGWMLETYDINAYDVLDEWIDINKADKVWGLDVFVLKQELEKTCDVIKKDIIITNERLTTLLYNAISCLEKYGCDRKQLEVDIGITEEEYKTITED